MTNSPFNEWYDQHKDFLQSRGVTVELAEIIWDSAHASAMHNIVASIQDGSISVKLTL